jgi:hypothetical protein
MPQSGIEFEKKESAMTKRVLDFFERVRYAYLSAKEDPEEYRSKWVKAIEDIKGEFDDISDFSRELKEYLKEKVLFSDEAKDPTTRQAKEVFDSIKEMRFESKGVSDPFSKQLGDDVIPTLLKQKHIFAAFIHYALRSHSNALPEKAWQKYKLPADKITHGFMGLDLEESDIPIYITEHYGNDETDSRRIKSKFKEALKILEEVFNGQYEEEDWEHLVELDLQKSEKSEDEKSEIDFIVPNKPLYRIFEIGDLKKLKGFTGEWVVQEKYDGMRIQIHKIDGDVKIYSYNEKDITDKCKAQVEQMEKKHFGDCILDAELLLFKGDEALHRASTVSHVFKKETEGTRLRAHVFDIMNHEGKSIADEPLKERINILFYQYGQHSSEDLAFPSKKDTRLADSIDEVEEYANKIMEMPTSEGVVIKDMESTYYIGNRKNPKWVKWKKFVDLDVIVLEAKKTKSNLHSYSLGIGPLSGEESREYKTKELEGKSYLPVGKAMNTKAKVKVGEIVRVKVDEVKKGKKDFKLISAQVIELPEVDTTDKIETLEELSTKTKKALEGGSVEYVFGEKIGDLFRPDTGLEKSLYITDFIHGEAEVILKGELDGFTIYGFKGDSLMAQNALHDIEKWKDDLSEVLKSKRSELRIGIRNEIIERGKALNIDKIEEFVIENYPKTYDELFNSDDGRLMSWLKQQEDLTYRHPNKFDSKQDVLEKDVEIKKRRNAHKFDDKSGNLGEFSLVLTDDGNLNFVINYRDKKMAWLMDIDDSEDIYNLFGKSGKFPAKVLDKIGTPKRTIDKGEIEIGVQKDGYHEYRLDGNKFQTRLHIRIVPLNEQKRWLAWTGKKQEMLDRKADDGIWNITEDKYADVELPPSEDESQNEDAK